VKRWRRLKNWRRLRVQHRLLAQYSNAESFKPVPERLIDVINGGSR
jgi:hypothetical protein